MEPFCNLLSDQRGVAASAVVDNEVQLDLFFYGLIHNPSSVFDHLRIQHAAHHFVEWKGFGIGFFIARPEGSDKPDDHLVSGVEKLRSHLGKLLPQRRQPGPQVRSDTKPQVE